MNDNMCAYACGNIITMLRCNQHMLLFATVSDLSPGLSILMNFLGSWILFSLVTDFYIV